MERERWIENIIDSGNGIKNIEPNDDLIFKIQNKIDAIEEKDNNFNWLIAASILIIISLNLGVFIHSNMKKKNNEISVLIENSNNQLY